MAVAGMVMMGLSNLGERRRFLVIVSEGSEVVMVVTMEVVVKVVVVVVVAVGAAKGLGLTFFAGRRGISMVVVMSSWFWVSV